jgi:uncharacterized membrane protein YagU involved in acid resistance
MTGVMYAGKSIGLLQTLPPKEITAHVQSMTDTETDGLAFSLSWLSAHLGFGAAVGALFPWLRQAYPGPPEVAGALFGVSVWFQAYVGLLPELGLFPPATEDTTSRQAVMVTAHMVYGATLGRLAGQK